MAILKLGNRSSKPFAMIDNRTLQDERLSLKSKGLLSYLLSLPDSWELHLSEIMQHSRDGRRAHRNALIELRELGYVTMERLRSEDSKRLNGVRYLVHERPVSESTLCAPTKRRSTERRSTELATINTHRREIHREREKHMPPSSSDGQCPSFGLPAKDESKEARLAQRFAEFTIKRRLHIGKKGSTHKGWSPRTIRQWTRKARDLIEQVGSYKKVKRTLLWYFEHFDDEYIPICHSFNRFAEKFSNVLMQKRRSENGHSKKEKGRVVNGVFEYEE